jgi:hypothetical protein
MMLSAAKSMVTTTHLLARAKQDQVDHIIRVGGEA